MPFEDDLSEEFATHIELQTRKYVAQGLSLEAARRKARIDFGALEAAREECREVQAWRWLDASERNVRHTLRSLRRSPFFVVMAIAILAIGIASNIAAFSAIDALFLRPLPVNRPNELVRIASLHKDGTAGALPFTVIDALKDDAAFQGFCGLDTSFNAAEVDGNLRQLGLASFTGSCFDLLGLRLQLGRGISQADDHPGTEPVAVITDSLWRDAFGGRPDVLGRPIRIDDRIYTIVGVTKPGFTGLLLGFPEPIMIPLQQEPDILHRYGPPYWVNVLARRAPGVTLSQAFANIAASKNQILAQSVPAQFTALRRKAYLEQKLTVTPARSGVDYFLRQRFGEPVYAILGLCGALLLMAGVNLTTLLLARSLSRFHEIGIRLALGASRTHIASIFALENAMLLVAGTAIGTLVGLWAAQTALNRIGRIFGNLHLDANPDVRVIGFLIAAFLVMVAMFTAASAWQAARLSDGAKQKQSGRGVAGSNTRAQKFLLATQIALTLALVAGAALFGASIRNMYKIDFGIKPENVWTMLVVPRPGGYSNFTPEPYYRDLVAQIESVPGVVSVTAGRMLPYGERNYDQPVSLIDGPQPVAGTSARVETIGERFFSTLGARVIAGEDFRATNAPSSETMVILSKSLAERLGNPRELIGHHLRIGIDPRYQRAKIKGVASDMDLDLSNLDNTRPLTIYADFWQDRADERAPALLIRTSGNSLDAAAIRHIVDRKGREFVERFETVSSDIDDALVENRFLAYISGAFGALALAMAAMGLFGLLSYQLTNRTAEIGIRVALGARERQIRWLIVRQAIAVLVPGCVAGIALIFLIQRLMSSLFYRATAYDPRLLSLSIAVIALSALAAAWLPVRRALRIDPASALRHE